MLKDIRKLFYQKIKELGYNITDTRRYEEVFPWLVMRTSNNQVGFSRDIRFESINLIIDIFSTYNGESEILDIAESITDLLPDFQSENPEIILATQSGLKVLQDNKTGPTKYHGILSYQFVLSVGQKEKLE